MNSDKRRVLLIRGLGHSGTTLMDLLLSSCQNYIGTGESIRVLRGPSMDESKGPAVIRTEKQNDMFCTCGKICVECPIWSPVLKYLKINDHLPISEKVDFFHSTLAKKFGNEIVWVDSSQSEVSEEVLLYLNRHYDLKIILLTRDIRSWSYSQRRKNGGSLTKHMLKWSRSMSRMERSLKHMEVSVLKIGYEEVAFRHMEVVNIVTDWVNKQVQDSLGTPESHIVVGNRMRNAFVQEFKVKYDAQWLSNKYSLIDNLMYYLNSKKNKDWVYSNDLL